MELNLSPAEAQALFEALTSYLLCRPVPPTDYELTLGGILSRLEEALPED